MYELENDLWLSKKKIYEKIEVIKFFLTLIGAQLLENWKMFRKKQKKTQNEIKKKKLFRSFKSFFPFR